MSYTPQSESGSEGSFLGGRHRLPSVAHLFQRLRAAAGGRQQSSQLNGSSLDDGRSLDALETQVPLLQRSQSKSVLYHRAAQKFQQLNTTYKSRKELQELEQVSLAWWCIHPHDIIAQCWWTFILATVMVTLFVEPYYLAFARYPGLYPLTSPDTLFALTFMTIYASDVALNFLVAYYDDNGELVTDMRRIAAHYAHWRLWVDLITTIPFDWLVLEVLGLQESDGTRAWYISLLRLLRLGRAYRLYTWVKLLTYNQTLSLVAVTLIRNFALCFYTVHWGACIFFYLAKQSGFDESSWVGSSMAGFPLLVSGSAFDKYIYSMYWSIITFSTVGYGDLHACSVPEAAFVVFYMFVSIGVACYFVASTTLLVVEEERKTGAYRNSLIVLDEFSATHNIPQPLVAAMKGHLRLHFSSSESSDEAVLAVYPTNIRRRILRHLYNNALHSCWLFRGCKQKFLDALLAAAKVELYMPKVSIISQGDQVNELYLVVAGQAVAERASPQDSLLLGEPFSLPGASAGSGVRLLGPGDAAGEMAFFTQTTCLEDIRTVGMCRVLVVSRPLFASLSADFPLSTSSLMNNLMAAAEELVCSEFPGPAGAAILDELDSGRAGSLAGLEVKFASAETATAGTTGTSTPINSQRSVSFASSLPGSSAAAGPVPPGAGSPFAAAACSTPPRTSGAATPPLLGRAGQLRAAQQQVLSNLLRVRALVSVTRARLEQQRTHEFLNACCDGNLDRLRVMLQQGCDVNCCDYDGRTGLMLAAAKGHTTAIKQLVAAGAAVNATDHQGGTALLEAVKAGHDDVIEQLLWAGGRLCLTPVMAAARLCTAVYDGDTKLLRRLLHAGAPASAGDYDRRTALHIAAADGSLPAVKMLIEEGGADPGVKDRWQQTPLDEARRIGAAPVVEYLASRVTGVASSDSQVRFQMWQAQEMLAAASRGRLAAVAKLLERGCPPDACDYDKRTGLMLAAANGQAGVVSLLLSAGANPNARDNLGGSPLLEAVKGGHAAVLGQLVAAGASLQLPDSELASALCLMVVRGDTQLLRRYIAAGADVAVGDYNQQTALHVAAARANAEVARLLVEEGGADVAAVDRWGATPAEEAKMAQAAELAEWLASPAAAAAAAAARAAAAERQAGSGRYGLVRPPEQQGA